MRAPRTNPQQRKKHIFEVAMALSSRIGHKNLTRDEVAQYVGVASSTVAKYYPTMGALKRAIFKEAIATECMPILQHCLSDKILSNLPEVRRKILKYLSDQI